MVASELQSKKENLRNDTGTHSLQALLEKLMLVGHANLIETINWHAFGEQFGAFVREQIRTMDAKPPTKN